MDMWYSTKAGSIPDSFLLISLDLLCYYCNLRIDTLKVESHGEVRLSGRRFESVSGVGSQEQAEGSSPSEVDVAVIA